MGILSWQESCIDGTVGLSQIIGDRDELVTAIKALQGSVETLKAEKAEMHRELNILKEKESVKNDENSINEPMEILEKAEKDAFVDPEKVGVQIESPTMSTEKMNSGEEKYLMETENDALVHSEQADMPIKLEAIRMTTDNSTENLSLVGFANTSVSNIQADLESLKAEQANPFVDVSNLMKSLVIKETNLEFEERNEERSASEIKQSILLETLKAENASLVNAVETLSREKANMHQFHSQVGRDNVNISSMITDQRFRIYVTLIFD